MYLLSKLDTNLLQLKAESLKENVVYLSLDDESRSSNGITELGLSDYSNTIKLSNNQYIAYHFSNSYSMLSLYSLSDTYNRRKFHIRLPDSLMSKHHTMVCYDAIDSLDFEMIFKNGMYLRISLPIDVILNNETKLTDDWFTLMNPYDFSIRIPHLLYRVSNELSVVFLEDGGLLGLKKINSSIVEPILFSDESYLKTLSKLFYRNKNTLTDKVVSCIAFFDKFLIVLTETCQLKIWNLETYTIIAEYNLANEAHLTIENNSKYDSIGNYLQIHDNILIAYLPFFNGIFQIGSLSITSDDEVSFNLVSSISSNLPSSSLWSLVDYTAINTLDLNLPESFIDIIILWKSGSANKLQILNITNENMNTYNWYETTNRPLEDIKLENEVDNSDLNKTLVELNSRYPACVLNETEKILKDNNISIPSREVLNSEYLANLGTLLKDVKNKCDQASSISILNDELIVINCQQIFNHSVYKINSSLERLYYNINDSSFDDDFSRYLMTVYGFSSTLSPHVLTQVSKQFLTIVTEKSSSKLSTNEKLTEIFKTTVESQLEISNINILFNELKSFDVIALLNTFIDGHLCAVSTNANNFVSAIIDDTMSNVIAIKSLYNQIIIQRDFVLKILLTFTLLDFDYSIFEKQLDTLIQLHYKQSLYVALYEQDKDKFTNEVLKETSKYNMGVKLNNNSELFSYTSYAISELYSFDIKFNPIYMRYLMDIVVYDIDSSIVKREQLLTDIVLRFYIQNDVHHEFFLAMLLFRCGKMEESYEFFQLHNYVELLKDNLPKSLKELLKTDSQNSWKLLLSTFNLPYCHSAYFYELSVLFANSNDLGAALKFIKKSLEYSSGYIKDEEPHSFKVNQLRQFMDLLINFSLYEEALDVLRLGHDVLNVETRTTYFEKLLLTTENKSGTFFSNLLRLCCLNGEEKIYLSPNDSEIIDKILFRQLHISNWESYKRLYSFRMIMKNDRGAAEILYDYTIQVGNNNLMVKKCYLMIGNILQSFTDYNDQWILYNGEIVTEESIREKLVKLHT